MLGPVNSPHLEHLALAVRGRGHDVLAAGAAWPGLPPSALTAAGIPVTLLGRPWPLALRRVLRTARADVVHAQFLPFAGAAALLGARGLIAQAWGSDVWRARRHEALANRLAVRRATAVVSDSTALLDRLVELGAPRERTFLLNWGVELERFQPAAAAERGALKRELGLGPGPVVLSARGLGEVYSPATVLEAFDRVAAAVPDAQLVVKHTAAEDPPIAGDRIHVVGRVAYERMPDYFRVADVCVSIPYSDSSPRSVWEAMACGAPCVLSDLPWVHELIDPGVHALVAPIEAPAVAAAVERLLTDQALARDVAAAGRALVLKHRDHAREMDRLDALYRATASSTVPSSPANRSRE